MAVCGVLQHQSASMLQQLRHRGDSCDGAHVEQGDKGALFAPQSCRCCRLATFAFRAGRSATTICKPDASGSSGSAPPCCPVACPDPEAPSAPGAAAAAAAGGGPIDRAGIGRTGGSTVGGGGGGAGAAACGCAAPAPGAMEPPAAGANNAANGPPALSASSFCRMASAIFASHVGMPSALRTAK